MRALRLDGARKPGVPSLNAAGRRWALGRPLGRHVVIDAQISGHADPAKVCDVSFDNHTLSAGPDLSAHSVRNVPGHVS